MQAFITGPYTNTRLKTLKRLWIGAVVTVSVLFAQGTAAAGPQRSTVVLHDLRLGTEFSAEQPVKSFAQPIAPKQKPTLNVNYTLTSYTSIEALTDASPFTTANGSHTAFGIVAANCLAFGTEIKIPALFGDQVFTVQDRLNASKGCGLIDVWLPTYKEAKQFGVKFTKVEVY